MAIKPAGASDMKIYRQINSNFHGDVAYVEHDLEPPKPVGFLCCGVFYEMGDIDEFCDREHTLLFTHPTTERRVMDEQFFTEWLCREMPAGTVIGNPKWWVPKILNALNAAPKGEV